MKSHSFTLDASKDEDLSINTNFHRRLLGDNLSSISSAGTTPPTTSKGNGLSSSYLLYLRDIAIFKSKLITFLDGYIAARKKTKLSFFRNKNLTTEKIKLAENLIQWVQATRDFKDIIGFTANTAAANQILEAARLHFFTDSRLEKLLRAALTRAFNIENSYQQNSRSPEFK